MDKEGELISRLRSILETMYTLIGSSSESGFESYDEFTKLLRDRKVYREEYFHTLLDAMVPEFTELIKLVRNAQYTQQRPNSNLENGAAKIRIFKTLTSIYHLLSDEVDESIEHLIELGDIIEKRYTHSEEYCTEKLIVLDVQLFIKLQKLKDSA